MVTELYLATLKRASLIQQGNHLWMLGWRRIYPHELRVNDTMGVRARPDHGGGGGFGTKLLQLSTVKYIIIPKGKLYC